MESWNNQKARWSEDLRRGLEKQPRDIFWTDSMVRGPSPGREERVKSLPLQYKRKECAERLGFLLLQWELQKRREEAEEKKGGVSPLKTCRDWERKRESQGQRESERARASVCPSQETRTSLLHSDWHWGRHQLASDPRGRPDQVTPVKTKWALPLPIPPLSTRECLGESSGNPNS